MNYITNIWSILSFRVKTLTELKMENNAYKLKSKIAIPTKMGSKKYQKR